MSKRFGRNQKRRMRLQVAGLERLVNKQAGRILELEQLGARNREIVRMTADVLGRHFITLDPSTIEVKRIDAISDTWRVAALSKMPAYIDWRVKGSDMAQQTFCEIALPVMKGGGVAGDLMNQQHFRFTYSGRTVGYSIQESALRMMHPDDAVERISREMASVLVSEIEKT